MVTIIYCVPSIGKLLIVMKRIYTVKLPTSIASAVDTTRTIPSNCFYPINYGDIKHMQWAAGNILRQRVITYDFLMECFEIHLQEDLGIEVAFTKPSLVFYYGFSGAMVCENQESGSSFTLSAGQYGAINVPLGKYRLILARGLMAGLLYIFDTKYLDNVLKMAPSDFRAGSHFRIGSPDCHKFPFFVIESIDQILEQLRSTSLEQKSLSIKMILIVLLKQYGEQLARYKNRLIGEAFDKTMSAKKFIETDIKSGPLPAVSEISRRFRIHPDTLNRAFKSNFGVGIQKYINQLKMQQAFLLLSQDKQPIVIVSEIMGYNSTSSFSTQFRSYYGFSPGQVAAKNKR
ncbi:AraC family transcriptional regulator [Dyadobacter frigoris]|uniref:Helix-turn-helix transcriptional regulator n=1 Tax=Dyadobacter frigoris TaxID=2576211 RepID=A0A4V6Y1T2_9BACT|nr:AraC family transcriptional regulator [Dyadobacter frigoris]TKT86003.1 helix-turn-helix transcriptional regulator [Dyadobacter frigoris]